MSYRIHILHGSSHGQSQQIRQNKFCNYVITNLRNYVIIIELKVWTPLSLLLLLLSVILLTVKCGVIELDVTGQEELSAMKVTLIFYNEIYKILLASSYFFYILSNKLLSARIS